MFILKFIAKLILIPAWLALLMIWLPVHLAVCISGMFHGVGRLLFGALALLAIILGMWENAVVFAAFIIGSFIVVLAGTVIEVAIEESRRRIGSFIMYV